jgi:hypothetical protein
MGKSTISMAIFNGYVSLPEGILPTWQLFLVDCSFWGPEFSDKTHIFHGSEFKDGITWADICLFSGRF